MRAVQGSPLRHPRVGKGPFWGRRGRWSQGTGHSTVRNFSGPGFQSPSLASVGLTHLAIWERGGKGGGRPCRVHPSSGVLFPALMGATESGSPRPRPLVAHGPLPPSPSSPMPPAVGLWEGEVSWVRCTARMALVPCANLAAATRSPGRVGPGLPATCTFTWAARVCLPLPRADPIRVWTPGLLPEVL